MTTALDFGHIPERHIGRRLRDAREDTGMSQREFAEATGIGQRTVTRYEQATGPDGLKRPVLVAWAVAAGVSLVWLETGERPEPLPGPGLSVVAGTGFEPVTSGSRASGGASFRPAASEKQAAFPMTPLPVAA